MIKSFALLPKKPGTSDEQFHRHWREVHAPLALRITSLRRYVQSHRLPQQIPNFTAAPYEGVAEVWFDNLETTMRMRDSPEYLEGAFKDEPNFIDVPGLTRLVTRENVVVAGPTFAKDTPTVKGLFLVKRKRGMSVAEFQDYWRTRHAPLVPRTPHLLRYVQCHVLPEMYEADTPPAYDGVAELWWPDLAKFQESWASPELQVEQFNDTRNFVDGKGSAALLVEEVRVIWL
ncbi:MAG: EthD domain-containing protein [Deltaproteobacteria bacterium]|nr:EthD domain-containing protein [Deltaproteobacteria bacterium]